MKSEKKPKIAKKAASRKTAKAVAPKKRAKKPAAKGKITPLMAEGAVTSMRRNAPSTIERTDRFKNIDDGLVPFKYGGSSYKSKGTIDVKDAVVLCQKAYYNIAVFRNMVDLMTEFSVSQIFYRKGSKKSREFFEALFNKINIWGLQDKFFREYFRSGNVFVYKFDAKLQKEDLKKITQVFGEGSLEEVSLQNSAASVNVPSRYVILNPADIKMGGTVSFTAGLYYKILTDYELHRLRNPQNEQDREVFDNLSDDIKKQIANKKTHLVMLPLDMDKVSAVFYKKMDYEPFAVPMGYPVLEDINFKQELKKMDMAIARTMQQAILLVTLGTEPDKGGINQDNLIAMQTLFENQSVGRVLISDYTTKAEFVVPHIGDLMDPKKYEIVNNDINMGLHNVFFGNKERYANQNAKIKVFVARLEQARQAFLNDFLIPEIKRIAKSLGFKNYPRPHFDEVSLRDDVLKDKVYTRLLELGVLSPEETFTAMETGRLPDPKESEENQEKLKRQKDKGFYEPLMGGPYSQRKMAKMKTTGPPAAGPEQGGPRGVRTTEEQGRPEGTKGIPQQTKKVTPVGGSEEKYSMEKIRENIVLSQKLKEGVCVHLRKKHGKRKLSKKQKEIASDITKIIIANENSENWESKMAEYCNKPADQNKKRILEIQNIASKHQISDYLASLLYISKV
jgi:hypothetical protein